MRVFGSRVAIILKFDSLISILILKTSVDFIKTTPSPIQQFYTVGREQYFMHSCTHKTSGIVYKDGRKANWTEPPENPWRARAQGKKVLGIPLMLYCDDTSGNVSKRWNKHNSYLFTLAGLHPSVAKLPHNIHFLCTSNLAGPTEMLEDLSAQLRCVHRQFIFIPKLSSNVLENRSLRTEGVVTYDCVDQTDVLVIPWVYAFQGDNPMQSEIASHIGLTGKKFCRVCHVSRGNPTRGQKVEESKTDYELALEFMTVRALFTIN